MKRNSSHISGRQSSTTKRPRFSQPGTFTRAQILGAPSRPLQWLSWSTPSTLPPLLQASSSSPKNARSNLPSQPAAPPSVRTAGDTDTLLSDALPPTRRAPFVRFIILVRLTDVRIQHAPGAGTISQLHPVVRPRPPIDATAVMTRLPPSKSVQLDLDLLSPPELSPQSPRVKTPWKWPSMGTKHPLVPRAGQVPIRWTSSHSDTILRRALHALVPFKAWAVLSRWRNPARPQPLRPVGYVPEMNNWPPQSRRRQASCLSLLSVI